MKTITTLLLSSFLLAGTINTAFAGEDGRRENAPRQRSEIKIKREASAERSTDRSGTTRTTTERRTEVNLPARNQDREIKVRTTEVRQEQRNRNEQANREVRPETNRNERSNAEARPESNRNERPRAEVRNNEQSHRRNQPRMESRSSERNPNYNRRANVSYHERQLRCAFCTGRGFTLHIDGFRHLRCNHCEGRGFRIYREMYVDACNVCYDPLHGQLECSLEELAWMETNRIAMALELSDRQRNRIFDINFRYITHRYNGDYYSTTRRDREIRHVLHLGQLVAFAILMNELHEGEVCYNCSNERY